MRPPAQRAARRSVTREEPPVRAPSLSPAPGVRQENDDAWHHYFMTASDAELRRFERALNGGKDD
jgi:hypothetical protein